jgi:glutamyl/glutaminyl-tRNA synthetase
VTRALVTADLATESELAERTDWFHTLIDLLKIRSRTIDDLVQQSLPYFRDDVTYDQDAVAKQWKDKSSTRDVLAAMRETLAGVHAWEPDIMESALRSLAEARGINAGKLFQPLRIALTGSAASPGIFDVLKLIGRERSLARIDASVSYVTRNA